jgi:ABC-type uncharacterized transport system permease subunit
MDSDMISFTRKRMVLIVAVLYALSVLMVAVYLLCNAEYISKFLDIMIMTGSSLDVISYVYLIVAVIYFVGMPIVLWKWRGRSGVGGRH